VPSAASRVATTELTTSTVLEASDVRNFARSHIFGFARRPHSIAVQRQQCGPAPGAAPATTTA
jgi:hypothetical protein